MRRVILAIAGIICTIISLEAQDLRYVSGEVMDKDGNPVQNAVLRADGKVISFTTDEKGVFAVEIPYTVLSISAESAYHKQRAMQIDGSYMVFELPLRPNVDPSTIPAPTTTSSSSNVSRWSAYSSRTNTEKQSTSQQSDLTDEKGQLNQQQDKLRQQEELKLQQEEFMKLQEEEVKLAAERERMRLDSLQLALESAKAAAVEKARLDAEKKKQDEENAKAAIAELQKKYAKQQPGFGSVIDVSGFWGMKGADGLGYSNSRFSATYTAGYRFNNQIFLGLGTGINLNGGKGQSYRSVVSKEEYSSFLNPTLISIPVFAYFKANMANNRTSPFFALAVGGNFSKKQTLCLDLCDVQYNTMGVFVDPQLGLNIRTSVKTSLYFAVGLTCFTAPYCSSYTGYSAVLRQALGYGIDFHLGFTF